MAKRKDYYELEDLKRSGVKKGDCLEVILKSGVDMEFNTDHNAYGYNTQMGTFDDQRGIRVVGYVDKLYSQKDEFPEEAVFMRSSILGGTNPDHHHRLSPSWYVAISAIYGWKKL